MKWPFLWSFGTCIGCGRFRLLFERRMSTAYVNPEDNFMTSCGTCYLATEEYWAERWRDYYNDLGIF